MASDDLSLSFVHWVFCPSLYGLWWTLSLLSIGMSVLLLFMASDDPFLFGPLGCLSFSLWPLMTPLSLVHWVVSPSSLYGLWWPLFLLSIGLSVPLFMASDEPIFFCPLGCLSFSLWPLMTPLSFVHWVVCPSLYGLWWTLSLWSIGLSLLLFMVSDDPFSFVHWVVCPSSLYGLWWHLSLLSIGLSVLPFMASDDPFLFLSIGLSVLLLFMASDDPSPFCPLGCLSLSLWPLMNPFSFVHLVVCSFSLYELWWPLSLLSIGLSVLLFMTSDDPFLFCPLCYLSFFSLWPLTTPLSFLHWVVCPSLYGLWWPLSRCYIGLSVLLFMASDDSFLFCPLGCLSFFSLWPLMTPLYFVHWVVCPSLYGLWWPFSLLSIGLSALLLFMASDDPSLSFVHWVFCPSLYGLWWTLSLLSIVMSVLLLFMASDDPSLFCPLGCLSFFSLWPLMSLFSFVQWVVCHSYLYGLWWPLSHLSIGLSVILLFLTSDDPFLFGPLGCLSFSFWPLMTPFSLVHWVVCPSLYDLWWPLSLWSIGLSLLLLFMASDDPFFFCPLGCLFLSLWPLMSPFSFVHWVVCPSSLYDLWWPLSLLSIGLSVLLCMASDEPFLFGPLGCLSFSLWSLMTLSLLSIGLSVLLLFMASDDTSLFCPLGCLSFPLWPLMTPFSFCPLGCLSFFSLWPLMTPLPFVHWVVCPYLYGLWWTLSLLSIWLSVLFLFMNSDDPFLFYPLGCLSFSLWPLLTPFSFVHCVICPFSLYDLWRLLSLFSIGLSVLLFMASDDPFLVVTLGCPSFSLWLLMTPFSFVHWVVCPSSLYGLWWPLSILSIGLSVLLFMASDDPFLFCPLGCLPFFSLWPLMTLHSLLSIGFSVLLFMASDEPFLFYPL